MTDTTREAFEAWAKSRSMALFRDSTPKENGGDGRYEYPCTNHAWWGYQAATERATLRPITQAETYCPRCASSTPHDIFPKGKFVTGEMRCIYCKNVSVTSTDVYQSSPVWQGGNT